MLHESAHVRIAIEFGIATLWLGFPGEPVNGLDAARLREFDAAIAALESNPHVRIVVVRSAKPAGFCAGLSPRALASLNTPADRPAFSWLGQQVFARLADLRPITVALIDGPCLGAGLELALACDYRLCLAGLNTHIGFPDRSACFGGSARLRNRMGSRRAQQFLASGRTLSGREAQALGIVDRAFCERRAKIELRTFLDELERCGSLPRRYSCLTGLADERRRFAQAPRTVSRTLPAALPIPVALARGFITPLEADQLGKQTKGAAANRELPKSAPELELAAA
jgi:enoyl-CoA hydratase